MKRFLLEKDFRSEFLKKVADPSLKYYWQNEYPMVSKRISPLLTRIDTFLRPKIIRNMLAQSHGIDLRKLMDENKTVLIKLSQGLIGEENSFMLGSLFLAKFNQAALSRQNLSKEQRSPFLLFCDEFQNYITPSIEKILSGTRKYGLGLILAHQELAQIKDSQVLNSVISNPFTGICFRLGDSDAKKMSDGFSYFNENHLQELERGKAIVRSGSRSQDFNLETFPLDNIDEGNSSIIIKNSREQYGVTKDVVEKKLNELYVTKENSPPKSSEKADVKKEPVVVKEEPIIENINSKDSPSKTNTDEKSTQQEPLPQSIPSEDFEARKTEYLEQATKQEKVRKHRSTQYRVRSLAQQRGFKCQLEKETSSSGKIDVALQFDDYKVAVEISVANSVDYEIQNIKKCLDDDYNLVFMVSDAREHLKKIKTKALNIIDAKFHHRIHFMNSDEISTYLDALQIKPEKNEKRVRGYKVKVDYKLNENQDHKRSEITKIIMDALRKKK